MFVPVNDVALTDVDMPAADCDETRVAVVRARAKGDSKELKRSEKALEKAEKKLKAAISRQTEVPDGRINPALGARVLPEHRIRQPRTFPSVTPDDPRVTFVWPHAKVSDGQLPTLAGLLGRLVRLGHSSSLVAARVNTDFVAETDPRSAWRPATGGEETLRVVQPGQLEALERSFAQHQETEPRVMPARFVGYTRQRVSASAVVPNSIFSDDWLILRRFDGPAVPMTATVGVARSLRRALMSFGGNPVPETLSGHDPDGNPLSGDHLAIVPLPFVSHSRPGAARHSSSGSILGVALIFPQSTDEAGRRAVFRRVAAWEQARRESDSEYQDADTPPLPLKLGSAGVLWLERVEWGTVAATLQSSTWCRESRTWYSATPLALDRNPGELRSRNPETLAKAIHEAESTIRRACERIGLPEPLEVELLPAAPVTGAAKAQSYPSFSSGGGRVTRVLTHARLSFSDPVSGPLLLGAGRYMGLGLFRPGSNHD